MHESIRLFISNCARSNVGRLVFAGYLVYLVSMIGYAYDHFPTATYPFRFYGERGLFELLNWPQIAFVRSVRLIFRWQASQFADTVAAFYIALPWWIYGYILESVVKRIIDASPAELPVDSVDFEFGATAPSEHLATGAVFDAASPAAVAPAGDLLGR